MKTEARIQQEIFTYHWNNYPEERGLLFMNHNNPKNAIDGARLKAMGLVAGVADMTFIRPNGKVMFLEIKTPEGNLSKVQKKWGQLIGESSLDYHIIRSLEDFLAIL